MLGDDTEEPLDSALPPTPGALVKKSSANRIDPGHLLQWESTGHEEFELDERQVTVSGGMKDLFFDNADQFANFVKAKPLSAYYFLQCLDARYMKLHDVYMESKQFAEAHAQKSHERGRR